MSIPQVPEQTQLRTRCTPPLGPMSGLERARRQVAGELLPVLAELLYRCDKGTKFARFDHLSEAAQSVYVGEALRLLTHERRTDRINAVHAIDAQHFALRDDEQEMVMRRARLDIQRFGGGVR